MNADDQLMLLDLTGMSGWLRAHGTEIRWPSGVTQATDTLTSQPRQARKDVARQAAPGERPGDAGHPIQGSASPRSSADLVDVVEKGASLAEREGARAIDHVL
jgi:hypothetical protein